MNKDIRYLRKAQWVMDSNVYPGYPFQMSVMIDMKTEDVWIDVRKRKTTISKLLKELAEAVAYQGIGCVKTTKGTWLQDSKMDSPKELIKADSDDYFFDNIEVVKLYYALNSAIRESSNTDNIIFACCDLDCEYVDCQVFKGKNKGKQIVKYVNDYFLGLE